MSKGMGLQLSEAEIDAHKTPAGGWTQKALAAWEAPWPPPKGWRRALIESKEARRDAGKFEDER
jgi:hypothetical protein